MQFRIKDNLDRLGKRMMADAQRAQARAGQDAVNHMANAIGKAQTQEIKRVFDNPTPWIQNSVAVIRANSWRSGALVKIKDEPSKGVPGAFILAAEIEGGNRRQKRFEKGLQRIGVMKPGWVAVPAPSMPRDSYGNVPASIYVTLLSYFGALGAFGSNMTQARKDRMAKGAGPRAKKMRRGLVYFVSDGKTQRPGIYSRTDFGEAGHGLKSLFLFVRKATYKKRYDFDRVAQQTFEDRWDDIFGPEVAQALA